MLRIITDFLRKKYWIYLFPALMDFSVAFLLLLVSVKAIRLNASPLQLGVLGSTWGVSYFISNLVLSRFASKRKANLFMILGCLLFIAVAPGFVFLHSLAALFVLAFLVGPATAFFFVGFQLFMGEGANFSVLKSTAFYTLGWSTGIAFGSLISGTLADLPPAIAMLPIVASSLLIIAGLRFVRRFSGENPAAAGKKMRHASSGLDRTVSPETEKAYLLVGWVGIVAASILGAGIRFLLPNLVIDVFGLSAAVAGSLIFLSYAVQAVFAFTLMKFPGWRYNFQAHSRLEFLGLAGTLLAFFVSGVFGAVLLAVTVGIYSAHAFYNGVFYSLCQHRRSGRNISINESLVGISGIAGPFIMGAALQAGTGWFFLASALVIAITCLVQSRLVRSAI